MKSKLLLRIAAGLVLFHLLGHTMGHLTWDKPEDPKMAHVVDTMKGYKADFMGVAKSMADYHVGYSYIVFGLYIMSIAMLWFASGFVNENRAIAQKMLYPLGLAYIFFGVAEYIYFFPLAAITSLLAGVCVIAAVARK